MLHRITYGWFLLQSLSCLVIWWPMMMLLPAYRPYFFASNLPTYAFWLFLCSDVLIYGLLGGLTSRALCKQSKHASLWALSCAAGICCSTSVALSTSATSNSAWLGAVLMVISAAGSMLLAILKHLALIHQRGHEPYGFQTAAPAPFWVILGKTALQCSVAWLSTLAAIPLLIRAAEQAMGIPAFSFAYHVPMGWMLFALLGALGLCSAWAMAKVGHGTPIPTDCASRLVVVGPYAYVRNPMAIAGLGQGYAVGLVLGSWSTLLYVTCGLLIWQYLARPREEAFLTQHFGEAYTHYQQNRRCWLPHLKAYPLLIKQQEDKA